MPKTCPHNTRTARRCNDILARIGAENVKELVRACSSLYANKEAQQHLTEEARELMALMKESEKVAYFQQRLARSHWALTKANFKKHFGEENYERRTILNSLDKVASKGLALDQFNAAVKREQAKRVNGQVKKVTKDDRIMPLDIMKAEKEVCKGQIGPFAARNELVEGSTGLQVKKITVGETESPVETDNEDTDMMGTTANYPPNNVTQQQPAMTTRSGSRRVQRSPPALPRSKRVRRKRSPEVEVHRAAPHQTSIISDEGIDLTETVLEDTVMPDNGGNNEINDLKEDDGDEDYGPSAMDGLDIAESTAPLFDVQTNADKGQNGTAPLNLSANNTIALQTISHSPPSSSAAAKSSPPPVSHPATQVAAPPIDSPAFAAHKEAPACAKAEGKNIEKSTEDKSGNSTGHDGGDTLIVDENIEELPAIENKGSVATAGSRRASPAGENIGSSAAEADTGEKAQGARDSDPNASDETLRRMESGDWLNTTAIYDVLAFLQSDNALLLDPSLVEVGDTLKDFREREMPKALTTAEHILIPLHGNSHWSVGALDKAKREWSHYDSGAPDGRASSRSQTLNRFAKFVYGDTKNTQVTEEDVAIQTDYVNCGIHAILNALDYMWGGDAGIPSSVTDHTQLARIIYAAILRDTLPSDRAIATLAFDDRTAVESLCEACKWHRSVFAKIRSGRSAARDAAHALVGDLEATCDTLAGLPGEHSPLIRRALEDVERRVGVERRGRAKHDVALRRLEVGVAAARACRRAVIARERARVEGKRAQGGHELEAQRALAEEKRREAERQLEELERKKREIDEAESYLALMDGLSDD